MCDNNILRTGICLPVWVPAVVCFCVFLLTLIPEVTSTQREVVVQRPLMFQCPDTRERSLHGVEMLASSEPLFKRSSLAQRSLGPEHLSQNTLRMWKVFARLSNPVNKRSVLPFFQGFRTPNVDLPTETYSPPLDEPMVTKRGKEIVNSIADLFRNYDVWRDKHQRQASNKGLKLLNIISPRPCGTSTPEKNTTDSDNVITPPSVKNIDNGMHEVKRQPINYVEPYSSELALPWSCQSERYWVDLGANVFPRYVSNTRCLNDTCWYGHYQCKPHRIEMPVLVEHFGACQDNRLPVNIRNQYLLSTTEVSGSCTCGRAREPFF